MPEAIIETLEQSLEGFSKLNYPRELPRRLLRRLPLRIIALSLLIVGRFRGFSARRDI